MSNTPSVQSNDMPPAVNEYENKIKASAVINFVQTITGAYCSGFIDNHPTVFDIHNAAVFHVKTNYSVEIPIWDGEMAKLSRKESHEEKVKELKTEIGNMRDWLQHIAINSGNENEVIDAVQSALSGEQKSEGNNV